MKKFANTKNCRTFVSGMRKQGSLDGIILLVISFSVINYVVSKSVRLRQADTLFFLCLFGKKKECQSRFTHGGSIPRHPLGRFAPDPRPHFELFLRMKPALGPELRPKSWTQHEGK